MLLDAETSAKVAHDIAHDAKEFLGYPDPETGEWVPGKWARLLSRPEDSPDGFVDFEFSNGRLLRMPCAWYSLLFAEGAERERIVFKRDGASATWEPGNHSAAGGPFSGIVSSAPVRAGTVTVGGISADKREGATGRIYIERPEFARIVVGGMVLAYCLVRSMAVDGASSIFGGAFENLIPEGNGHIDANLEAVDGDSIEAASLECTGERVIAVERMNMWGGGSPKTDADYSGVIPFLPFNDGAGPINGFDNPLDSNPFFPDWFYTIGSRAERWKADYAWVPSLTDPDYPAWCDSDGIYWYQARVETVAYNFGAPAMIFPPRCRAEGSSDAVVAPVTAAADGLIVTIKNIGSGMLEYVTVDRYEYKNGDTWTWYPGRSISVAPGISQFVVKRVFTVVDGRITAVEYQLLPLGGTSANL